MIFKVVHLFSDTGEFGRLPDGGIINAGGVAGSTFTVGGKALLFADGTTTDGGIGTISGTLQSVYDNGTNGTINLSAGKDFVISALNHKIFQVDASSGTVTITGDLTVLGSSTVIDGTLANVDQVSINPPDGTAPGLIIEPMVGATMSTDLVRIRSVNAGPSVFTIDASGNTSLKQLTVAGTINGINLTQFYADFENHLNGAGAQHNATQVSVDSTHFANITGGNVQQALESIDSALSTAEGLIKTYEHIQSLPATTWNVAHSKGSSRPTITIFDETNSEVWPDQVNIIDANTIQVTFNTPISGRAITLLF